MLSKLIVSSVFAALTLAVAGTAGAQTGGDYETYFTFSAPVTLPGVTLPAGKYLFRLADPNGSRKVINVLSADGKKSLAILHSIPNQLLRAPQQPEVRFMETPANTPPPVKTWWYPGKSIGYEFIYPRQQALQLAKVTQEPVLTTRTETKQIESADLARISGAGAPALVTVEETPAPAAATGRVQQGEVAPAASTPAAAPPPEARIARTRLPQTASSLPLMALLGGLAMFAGIGLLLWRRPVL